MCLEDPDGSSWEKKNSAVSKNLIGICLSAKLSIGQSQADLGYVLSCLMSTVFD